jgi:tripartite-type tricarboxylate transporter receptor subunit TctC
MNPVLRLLTLTFLTTLLAGCSSEDNATTGNADTWPDKPIRVIIPFGPGGLADVTMRLAGEALGQVLGERLVMENRPGAGGVAATTTMLNADADGYTLIVLTNGTTIAETLFDDLPYTITEDLVPVSAVAWFDLVLLVNPDSGYSDLQTLLNDRGDNLRIATINPGSTQNLSAELFKSLASRNATIIPYRTTPDVLGALLRGEVDLAIDAYTALKGAIDNNQVRPIAVTGEVRNPAMPDIPTAAESGITDFVVTGWNALYARTGTDTAIIERLNTELAKVLATDDISTRFAELGVEARTNSPQAMQQRLLTDIQKWRQVIEAAGIDTL